MNGGTKETETSSFAVLRQRPFGVIWTANVLSNIGNQVQVVAAAWLMVTLAASPQMVALVHTAGSLPTMLFALFAGAIADTHDRRRVMMVAQLGMMIVAGSLAALAYLDRLTPALLLALIFMTGLGTAFNLPAWHASVGDMLPRKDLPGAISLNAAGFNVSRSVGPAIGGLIVTFGGAALAFAANALSYAALVAALTQWRSKPAPQLHPRERLDRAMRTGVGYILMSPASRAVLVRGTTFSLGACAPLALLPSVVSDLFRGDAVVFGILLGAFGFGAVSAALLGVPFRKRHSHEVVVRTSMSLIAVATVVIAFSPYLGLTGIALVLAGSGWSLSLTTFNTNLQYSIPRWVVARALALYQTGNSAGIAIGSWLWGAIATDLGLRAALASSALLIVLSVGIGLVRPLHNSRGDEQEQAAPSRELLAAIPVRDSQGPVIVFVQYRIPRANIRRFKSLMAGQRRIRLRDGALQWALLRDVEDDELWIEQYELSTWSEYLHHRDRRTKADQPLTRAIADVLRVGTRPVVTRTVRRSLSRFPVQPAEGV